MELYGGEMPVMKDSQSVTARETEYSRTDSILHTDAGQKHRRATMTLKPVDHAPQ